MSKPFARILGLLCISAFLCLSVASDLQAGSLYDDAPPLGILNVGVGASALGMGGAVVGSDQGIESLVWNPAGLQSMSRGWRFTLEGQHYGGRQSNNIQEEGRYISSATYGYLQDYNLSGTQMDFLAAGYSTGESRHRIGFAIGWRRTEFLPPKYAPTQPAIGHAEDITFAGGDIVSLSGPLSVENKWDESGHPGEILIGGAVEIKNHISIGVSFHHRVGEQATKYHLTSQLDLSNATVEPPLEEHESQNIDQELTARTSANYFTLSALVPVDPHFSAGATLVLPHKNDLSVTFPNGYHQDHDPFEASAQITLGATIHPNDMWSIGASWTYEENAGDLSGYVGDVVSYDGFQQWRFGVERRWSHWATRGGLIVDEQKKELTLNNGDVNLYAFTAGFGYSFDVGHVKTSLNVAYWRETGSGQTQDGRIGSIISDAAFGRLIIGICTEL